MLKTKEFKTKEEVETWANQYNIKITGVMSAECGGILVFYEI